MDKCSSTIKEIHIQDNKSINRAVPDLVDVLSNCKKLEVLNISDLNLKKKFADQVVNAVLKSA